VTLGRRFYTAVAAADDLQARFGISAEIVDLALPFAELRAAGESVRKTGKALLLSDAVERGSVMQTVAANLTQLCFDDLDAPPVVLDRATGSHPPRSWKRCSFRSPLDPGCDS